MDRFLNRAVTGACLAGAAVLLSAAWRRGQYTFNGRVVLISGGSRGLGLLIARQAAEEGARIVLLARDAEENRRAAAELRERGAEVLAIRCDVTDQSQVDSAVERVVEEFGSVDVLINVAGVIQVGPLDHMDLEDFESSLAVHVYGPLHLAMAVVPIMRQAGGGRIVNISSIGGRVAVPHLAPYCVGKFALVGLSESLQGELRRDGILVTTVCPGLMRTGSPPNARFKGRHRSEYAWFAVSDAIPLLSMSGERAARKVLDACRSGTARVTLGIPAKAAVMLDQLLPSMTSRLRALAETLLPDPDPEHSSRSYSGWESQSRWAPSLLTRLSDRATIRNNEAGERRGRRLDR